MTDVDYASLIPNNVDLKSDKRLQRALEAWYPKYIDWWKNMGTRWLPGSRGISAHRGWR